MSQENVDVVRQVVQAFNQRDLAAMTQRFDPEMPFRDEEGCRRKQVAEAAARVAARVPSGWNWSDVGVFVLAWIPADRCARHGDTLRLRHLRGVLGPSFGLMVALLAYRWRTRRREPIRIACDGQTDPS